jgi:hypothetical protein
MNRSFVWGAVFGIGGLYLFHRFVKPVPGKGA